MPLFPKKKINVFTVPASTSMPIYEQPQLPAPQAALTPPPALDDAPSIPSGMWEKCPGCSRLIYSEDLQDTLKVCPHCAHHFRLTAQQRIGYTADESSFVELFADVVGANPLDFPDYDEKLKKTRSFTGLKEAVVCGLANVDGLPCVMCAMDGFFIMGSMGYAVGEKLALAAEEAVKRKLPLVVFTVSGGARMQEGMVSLMQMAKVSGAIGRLHDAGLFYLVVLTDPTTGGVTASFAMLGDITLAEPNALIGFAGRRVIEQAMQKSLPESFQRAEFLLEKGFIDAIVPRSRMKHTISRLLKLHERRGM